MEEFDSAVGDEKKLIVCGGRDNGRLVENCSSCLAANDDADVADDELDVDDDDVVRFFLPVVAVEEEEDDDDDEGRVGLDKTYSITCCRYS